MKRKVINLMLLCLFIFSLSSCSNRQVLLFLNWGEYIDETLIEAFEDKENCTVIMDLGDSNEIFYSKVRGGTTVYDVVCPSDYMVEKMYANDMLQEIKFDNIPTYKTYLENDMILEGVKSIASTMEAENEGISNYYVPYLWGTWGIMYSTLVEGLEKSILSNENEWACLFDRNSLPKNTKVAMYDSHQHAYYAACKYLGIDNTKELESSELKQIHDLVKNMNFNAWGTDNIKKDIVAQNIDVGFMWTGDFLYYYCENIASVVMDAYLNGDITIEDFKNIIISITGDERKYEVNQKTYQVGFDIFIPKDTIAFCDNLVITKDAAHTELAYKFIDFMCSESITINKNKSSNEVITYEVTPAYSNTYYVCYNTPFTTIYDEIVALSNDDFTISDETLFNEELKSGVDAYDSTLYYKVYDYATGIAFDKYYPKTEVKGKILHSFSRNYVNTINTTFNNARV